MLDAIRHLGAENLTYRTFGAPITALLGRCMKDVFSTTSAEGFGRQEQALAIHARYTSKTLPLRLSRCWPIPEYRICGHSSLPMVRVVRLESWKVSELRLNICFA